jgi:two-component system chemotaxis sensor kinase CheA
MVNKKILIVEDDQYIRDIYKSTLEEAGFNVTTAVDGEEGLLKAKEGGYDLILLDMMMPKVDGIQFLTSIKADPPKKPNGSTILLTNLAQDPVINQGMDLGAKSYISKADVNPAEFLEKIKEFV